MINSEIVTPAWVHERGGLHDSRISSITQSKGSLLIHIDDGWSNFCGLEGYPGKQPGTLRVAKLAQAPSVQGHDLKGTIDDVVVTEKVGGGVELLITGHGDWCISATGDVVDWTPSEF
jgi:hypothetical protein